MKKFIITDSKKTADVLTANGFILVNSDGGMWTFVNEPHKMNFQSIEHITYTDVLRF